MGQRSQIIVSLPKYFINENNHNNRGKEWLVFHNQWLYGYGFIKHLVEILEIFSLIRDNTKESSLGRFTLDYKGMLDKAILCANYKDPTNIRRTEKYFDAKEENDNKKIISIGSWAKLFKELDNNNGFIFLRIDSHGKIGFDILNGTEDADEIARKSPEKYLRLFLKKEEMSDKEVVSLLDRLKEFPNINYKTKIKFPKVEQ